jgi:hypothetical protein
MDQQGMPKYKHNSSLCLHCIGPCSAKNIAADKLDALSHVYRPCVRVVAPCRPSEAHDNWHVDGVLQRRICQIVCAPHFRPSMPSDRLDALMHGLVKREVNNPSLDAGTVERGVGPNSGARVTERIFTGEGYTMQNKFIELRTLGKRSTTLKKYSAFARSAPTAAKCAHRTAPLGSGKVTGSAMVLDVGSTNSNATTRVKQRGAPVGERSVGQQSGRGWRRQRQRDVNLPSSRRRQPTLRTRDGADAVTGTGSRV